jgi:predicted metal-dependent phosphoesterase TrpH
MYSDGSYRPKELVDLAFSLGFSGLSITDHDTLIAFSECNAYAVSKGLLLLPGVEISADYEKEPVHVLGYSFSPESPSLHEFCRKHRLRREERNQKMLEKLSKAGMTVTMEEVKALSPEASSYGRPHIALALLKKGYIHDLVSAFTHYLGSGKPCYVPGEKWTVQEAIDAVHEAGGKAILAHPHLLNQRKVVEALLTMPFDGLEGYYDGAPLKDNERWCQEAKKRKWLVTGGSDFHGSFRPKVPFGSSWAPEETIDVLQECFLLHEFRS